MTNHESSDEPLAPKLIHKLPNALHGLGHFLEPQVRGEPVPATPEALRDIMVTGLSTIHEETLEVAEAIDRFVSEVQEVLVRNIPKDIAERLFWDLNMLHQETVEAAGKVDALKVTIRELGGTD